MIMNTITQSNFNQSFPTMKAKVFAFKLYMHDKKNNWGKDYSETYLPPLKKKY